MLRLLKGDEDEGKPAPAHGDRIGPDEEDAIVCRSCGRVITTRDAKTSVHGAHEHRRVNPSGVGFHVGCFSRAPGCELEGAPTLFWTWFPGYAWQIAMCGGCDAHLGWAFTGDVQFFALILDRLAGL